MDVPNINSRPYGMAPEAEVVLRRLEDAVRDADRIVPPPPAQPGALVELSIIAARLLRGV